MSKIKALIINEGITCGRIIFYLAFIVEKKKKMIITFKVCSACLFSFVHSVGSEAEIGSSAGCIPWHPYAFMRDSSLCFSLSRIAYP